MKKMENAHTERNSGVAQILAVNGQIEESKVSRIDATAQVTLAKRTTSDIGIQPSPRTQNVQTSPRTCQSPSNNRRPLVNVDTYMEKIFDGDRKALGSSQKSTEPQVIVLDKSMEVILMNGTQKELEELKKQLKEAQAEINSMNAYMKLKEQEIMYLNERVSNE